jgi:hypothetical protein
LEELAEDVTASVRVTYGVSALLERKIAEINAAIAELQARDDARVTKALTDATERLERGATACEEAARHFAQTAENLHRMTETLGNLNQAMETTTRLSREADAVWVSMADRLGRMEATVTTLVASLTGKLVMVEKTMDKSTSVFSRRLDNLDDQAELQKRLSHRLDQIERSLDTKLKGLAAEIARIAERTSKDDPRVKSALDEALTLQKKGAAIYEDSAALISKTAIQFDRTLETTSTTLTERLDQIEKSADSRFQHLSSALTEVNVTNATIVKAVLKLYEAQATQTDTPATALASLKNDCQLLRDTILNAEAKSLTASHAVKESLLQRLFTLETTLDKRLAALEWKVGGGR